MRLTIALILSMSLLAAPFPARAEGAGDGAPGWIRWTVGGVIVLGGLLYLHKQVSSEESATRKTLKQSALDIIAYVSTPEERAELKALDSKDEVQGFLTRFFIEHDPTPETPENEFRDELVKRFRYANANLEDRGEGWKSDAGRVHIIYGPPETILRANMLSFPSASGLQWKYVELWEYSRAAGGNPVPNILRDPVLFDAAFHLPPPSLGRMLFMFARKTDGGRLVQVYSTEPGEVVDAEL